MRKIIPILFLAFISLTAMAQEGAAKEEAVVSGPVMKFEKKSHGFGEIFVKDGKVSHEFKFINDGTEPLIISKAKGSCGCTVPKYPRGPIMPGEEASVKVVFNPKGKKGKIHKTVTLTYNSGVPGETKQKKISIGAIVKQ
ncbi:MAG: DUF1573 domain-containing protein [Chitinophagales bacterium]